jgi:hypothetical protein
MVIILVYKVYLVSPAGIYNAGIMNTVFGKLD